MTELANREACVGCGACRAACNYGAISMQTDYEGFLYPVIDNELCINCGKCADACCALRPPVFIEANAIYAAVCKDESIRMHSSSGGIFSMLANAMLDRGGVVYGAAFDANFRVTHVRAEREADIAPLRGSKYVQSDTTEVFLQVVADLQEQRGILFSGTPCQIAALKQFLLRTRTDTTRLLLCDIICHGTPSPMVWAEYLRMLETEHENKRIVACKFRGKEDGWHASSAVRYRTENNDMLHTDRRFTELFLNNYILRPACHNCPFTSPDRVSDITIADFWGVETTENAHLDDDKGVSLVLVNSEKGSELFEEIRAHITASEATIEAARGNQKTLNEPFPAPRDRDAFWRDYVAYGIQAAMEKYLNLHREEPLPAIADGTTVIIPSDGPGSRGDEGMLRGLLRMVKRRPVIFTPGMKRWRDYLPDIADSFDEYLISFAHVRDILRKNVHLLVMGADVLDGTCGIQTAMERWDMVRAVCEAGGSARVFGSFRSDVAPEIVDAVKRLPRNVRFSLRDDLSVNHFKAQCGREADYFPDLAFFCQQKQSRMTERFVGDVEAKRAAGKGIIGVNFAETSFRSFYAEHTMDARSAYIKETLACIFQTIPDAIVVLISNDVRKWDGHFSDADYQQLAMRVADGMGQASRVMVLPPDATYIEILSVMPLLDLMITGRMHLSIAAIKSAVVPIVYTGASIDGKFSMIDKVKGMLQTWIGRPDLAAVSLDELSDILKTVMSQREGVVETIKSNSLAQHCADVQFAPDLFEPDAWPLQDVSDATYFELLLRKGEDASACTLALKQEMDSAVASMSGEMERAVASMSGEMERAVTAVNEEMERAVAALNRQLEQRDEHIDAMTQSLVHLRTQFDAVIGSRTWRVAHGCSTLIRKVIPPGSWLSTCFGASKRKVSRRR